MLMQSQSDFYDSVASCAFSKFLGLPITELGMFPEAELREVGCIRSKLLANM